MMNKTWMNIGLWMLLVCTSCAISKKENERMDQILSQQANTTDIKIADTLTPDLLRNFETRAIQKLEEFYDYANLLSNDDYSLPMKSEIRISAQGLFFDPHKSINPFNSSLELENTVELVLIEHQDAGIYKNLSVSSIEVVTPLHESTANRYNGNLSFQLSIGKEDDQKIMLKSAWFSVRKIEKTLGKESVNIWEVFLERIE